MTWWERLALTVVEALLHGAVKNPKRIAGAEALIVHLRDDAAELALSLDPNVPPPPGYRLA